MVLAGQQTGNAWLSLWRETGWTQKMGRSLFLLTVSMLHKSRCLGCRTSKVVGGWVEYVICGQWRLAVPYLACTPQKTKPSSRNQAKTLGRNGG